MVTRRLGRTGMMVSEIVFGGVEIGIPYGIGVHSSADMLTDESAVELLRSAFYSGINFYDTARMYGKSEELIGKAFSAKREQVIIASKVAHFLEKDGSLPPPGRLEEVIFDSVSTSLDALDTSYLDILMLHQGDEMILRSNEVVQVFKSLKASGKIRAAGVSTYTLSQTALAIESGNWDVIQIPFNVLDQQHSVLFERAVRADVGLVVRSVLLKGLLTEKGRQLHTALVDVEDHIARVRALAAMQQLDIAMLATRFALSHPQVSSILVGIDKQQYLQESLKAASGEYFNDELMSSIRSLQYPEPGFLDLPKWDREGWLR